MATLAEIIQRRIHELNVFDDETNPVPLSNVFIAVDSPQFALPLKIPYDDILDAQPLEGKTEITADEQFISFGVSLSDNNYEVLIWKCVQVTNDGSNTHETIVPYRFPGTSLDDYKEVNGFNIGFLTGNRPDYIFWSIKKL